mgnify:CR=1 FL=1
MTNEEFIKTKYEVTLQLRNKGKFTDLYIPLMVEIICRIENYAIISDNEFRAIINDRVKRISKIKLNLK